MIISLFCFVNIYEAQIRSNNHNIGIVPNLHQYTNNLAVQINNKNSDMYSHLKMDAAYAILFLILNLISAVYYDIKYNEAKERFKIFYIGISIGLFISFDFLTCAILLSHSTIVFAKFMISIFVVSGIIYLYGLICIYNIERNIMNRYKYRINNK